MKAASEFFGHLYGMDPAEQLETLKATKGRELAGLLHYLEGCEKVNVVEQLMIFVLMVSGRRYLTKQAAKTAKKVKRILW